MMGDGRNLATKKNLFSFPSVDFINISHELALWRIGLTESVLKEKSPYYITIWINWGERSKNIEFLL